MCVWSSAPSWSWPHAEAGFSHWTDSIICTMLCQLEFPVSFLKCFTVEKSKKSKKQKTIREWHSQSSSQLHSRFGAASSESLQRLHTEGKKPNQIKIYKLKIKNQQPKHWVRGEQGKILSWVEPGGDLGYRPTQGRDQAKLWHPAGARPATSSQIFLWNVTIPLTRNAFKKFWPEPQLCGTAASTGSLALFFILNWETPFSVKFVKPFLPTNPLKNAS